MLLRIAKALNSSTSIAVAVTIPVLLMIGMTLVIPVGGDDGWIHLNWIPQFTHLVKEGYLQPRWLPDSFGGYGIPAFYFYPPLPYWFITVVSVIIPSASSSALLYITCLFGSIISVLTLFLYLKQLQISRVSALLGAIMYGFGTYRLLDIFSRNALGEQFAFAFLPLIFLSIELAASDNPRNRMRSFFIGLAGWIGLLLTNIPCVIIAGLAMIVYCLARGTLFQPRRWVLILVPIVGAACCTAFYLLPLAHFRTQVQLDQLWIYGSSGEGFTYLRQEYYDLRSTKTLMIAVGILTAVILQRMLHRNAAPRQAKVIFWLLVLSVGLQLPFIGVILHSIVFPLTILQFYWRWDVLLLLALCSTFSFIHSEGTSKWYQYFLPILFCIRSILLAVFLYTTATPIKLDRYRVDVGEYVPATVPYTWRDLGRWLDDHETFTTVIKISDSVSIKKIDSYRTEIHTSFSQPQQITFNLFYWPQWKLRRTDRTEIPASADSEGRLTALIPAGNQFINLQLEKSTSEKIGAIISLVALSLVGMIAYVFRIKREK